MAPVTVKTDAEIIRVDRPTSTQVFNTNDIVVSMDGKTLSSVALAKWSEATPVLIQETLVDALESSADFIGVIPSSGARTSTRVHVTIKNFEAKFDNGPEMAPLAVVQYRVTYAKADDRKLIGMHLVSETHRANSINVSSIVDAIELANQAAMVNIVEWLETQRAQKSG